VDNRFELRDARISRRAEYRTVQDRLCDTDIPVIMTCASVREVSDQLYTDKQAAKQTVPLKLIPYFARANRGVTELNTWFLLED
jgi:hypothetical protein